eukprot:jgi/Astpho2/3064/e_gw1.00051.317.1_t
MGKRKSSAKPPPKKQRPKLAATFNCPFCNSNNTVACTLDRDRGAGKAPRLHLASSCIPPSGSVTCSVCGVGYSTEINSLSEPIDVYSEWIGEAQASHYTLLGNMQAGRQGC